MENLLIYIRNKLKKLILKLRENLNRPVANKKKTKVKFSKNLNKHLVSIKLWSAVDFVN